MVGALLFVAAMLLLPLGMTWLFLGVTGRRPGPMAQMTASAGETRVVLGGLGLALTAIGVGALLLAAGLLSFSTAQHWLSICLVCVSLLLLGVDRHRKRVWPFTALVGPPKLSFAPTPASDLYSPDRLWRWDGTEWVAAPTQRSISQPGASLATTSLLLAIFSWIFGAIGFVFMAFNPNGGLGELIASLAPTALVAIAAIVVAILSMRVTGRTHLPPRQTATAGLVVGALAVMLNAAFWLLAFALTGFSSPS